MSNKPAHVLIYYLTSLGGMLALSGWISFFAEGSVRWWLLTLAMFVVLLASAFTAVAANRMREHTLAFSWSTSLLIRLAEFSAVTLVMSFAALFVFLWLAISGYNIM